MQRNTRNSSFGTWCRLAAAALLAGAVALPAAADVNEARRMLDEGRAARALDILNERLISAPQDAELRFLRGLALSRLGRQKEAIDVFSGLTRDYPHLPEPFNNLAVIYAQQGDYERARNALEAALATHPSYATAHENLGDIYAAMASASYSRALTLGDSSSGLQAKLRVMEQLGSAPSSLAVARAAEPAPSVSETPPEVAAVSPAPEEAPAAPEPVPQSEPVAAAPAPADDSAALRESVSEAVMRWADAWQRQDADTYLASYATDFAPAGGVSRPDWEDMRRQRLSAPSWIRVVVHEPEIQVVSDNQVRVVFQQEYESDIFESNTRKMLDMRRSDDRWLILRETSS